MPHPVVTRDPNHPDFPHGTDRGARRGCPCTPCTTMRRRVDKQRSIARAQGRASILTEEQTARVTAHLRRLLDSHPGVTLPVIATASNTHVQTISSLLHGTQRTLRRTTAKKLTAVTAATLTPTGYPSEKAMLMYGQLAALGYPRTWIEKEAGVSIRGFLSRPPALVTPRFHDALADLLDRVGDRDITHNPEALSQASAQAVHWARAFAEKHGYYPRSCYDDSGSLDYRLVPGHPWAETDEYAIGKVEDMRILTSRNHDERQYRMARALGLASAVHLPTEDNDIRERDPALWTRTETLRRRLERLKKRHGMLDKDHGREDRVLRWRELIAEYDNREEDSVAFALRTGLINARRQEVASDHPAVVEYLAATKAEAA